MNKKSVLRYGVLVLMLVGLAFIGRIFVTSLAPSAREKSQIVKIGLLDYKPGDVRLVRGDGPVYVIAHSDEILNDLDILSDHVWDQKINTLYKAGNGKSFFIFNGRSTIEPGCLIKHYPKTQPNIFRADDAKWYGGFLDPCRDVSYDYAGRLIKSISHSYVNFTKKAPNIYPPKFTHEDKEGLHVFHAQR
jgi:hypothetical protein